LDGGRQWACAQAATGRVLEVGIGTGRNLGWYPHAVEVVGVDVSLKMLAVARGRTDERARSVQLSVVDAQRLSFRDASFDTVVATLALCSIPDHQLAVQEMARVLRPGGRLILLEHVASPNWLVRVVQRLLDPVTVRFQGDHLLREPDIAVSNEGLVIDEFDRLKWGIVARLTAHKPAEPDS
jgi:ubiquinone/menaquinone biosynthesis C-methylase UbiE